MPSLCNIPVPVPVQRRPHVLNLVPVELYHQYFFKKINKKIHESYQRIFSGVRPENLRYALGTLERFSIAVGFVTFFADATKTRFLPLRVNDSVIDA